MGRFLCRQASLRGALGLAALVPFAGCKIPRWATEEMAQNRAREQDERSLWKEATSGAWDGSATGYEKEE